MEEAIGKSRTRLFGILSVSGVLRWPSRYFGRAKELPGVKELLEAAKPQPAEKAAETRVDLHKNVDAYYYGYNDGEEEAELLKYEDEEESKAAKEVEKQGQWGEDNDWQPLPGDADGQGWVLPTLAQVQEELIERRRRRLLDQLE